MSGWKYSKRKLAALDVEIERLGAEIDDVVNHADQRLKATQERYRVLGIKYAAATDERDRCAMALWRRSRNS